MSTTGDDYSTPAIVLDVDGILHPLNSKGIPRDAQVSELVCREEGETVAGEFSPECMAALAQCVNACGAEIILSSSRRTSPGFRAAVDDQLRRCGLPASSACTPSLPGGRHAEILAWAKTRKSCWVALDDWQALSCLPRERTVVVDHSVGLTSDDAERAMDLLQAQAQKAMGIEETRIALRWRLGLRRKLESLRLSAFHRTPTGGGEAADVLGSRAADDDESDGRREWNQNYPGHL